MTSNIKQEDLVFADQQGQGNTVGIGEPDSMASGKFTSELVKPESCLERVLLQSAYGCGKAGFKVRVLLEEPAGLPEKLF